MTFRKPLVSLTIAAALAATALTPLVIPVSASARVVVDVRLGAPPPARWERHGRNPYRNGVWINGHWGHRGGQWYWVGGRWDRPYGGYHKWVPGHYNKYDEWVEGHWN